MDNEEQFQATTTLAILGPALRTSPERAAQDIPGFWQKFLSEGWLERLPRRQDDAAVYAVYCEYERDHTGPYTMILGVAVNNDEASAPAGARRVQIPTGRYARFGAKGDPAQVIWRAWQHINSDWMERNQRRYAADYERYPLSALASMATGSVEADIVVGMT